MAEVLKNKEDIGRLVDVFQNFYAAKYGVSPEEVDNDFLQKIAEEEAKIITKRAHDQGHEIMTEEEVASLKRKAEIEFGL